MVASDDEAMPNSNTCPVPNSKTKVEIW